jgi:hypothetical protein
MNQHFLLYQSQKYIEVESTYQEQLQRQGLVLVLEPLEKLIWDDQMI